MSGVSLPAKAPLHAAGTMRFHAWAPVAAFSARVTPALSSIVFFAKASTLASLELFRASSDDWVAKRQLALAWRRKASAGTGAGAAGTAAVVAEIEAASAGPRA